MSKAPSSREASGTKLELFYIGPVIGGYLVFVFALLAGCAKPHFENSASSTRGEPERSAFFIAPNGNDAWSGGLASPNRQRMDGPFATVARALRAVRENRARGIEQDGNIVIRGGVYFLDKPLVIGPEDTGVVLSAYRNEKPIISGGRRI